MNELIFYIEQNLIQIEALRLARIKKPEAETILMKREEQVRRDVNRLRMFAQRKSGAVSEICNGIADSIQQRLAY